MSIFDYVTIDSPDNTGGFLVPRPSIEIARRAMELMWPECDMVESVDGNYKMVKRTTH